MRCFGKGARVSTHINLPGRYIVLLPNVPFITVSGKIDDGSKKKELLNIVKKILPKEHGLIVRTVATQATETEIKKDIEEALKTWDKIVSDFSENCLNDNRLIYKELDLTEKTARDMIRNNINLIITNSKKELNTVSNMIKSYNLQEIEARLEEDDLVKKYYLQGQIEKRNERKIWLKSGGYIAIDKTEALTAIDVNSGKYTGSKNIEQTSLDINIEATIEIAKQLRLKDIGGIIVIDYIDLHDEENKKKLTKALTNELKQDRAKTEVKEFTKLNLMEMTRKHMWSGK